MMELELDIDQSHLPRVQEVCQCFAVLEDGAFAHNLQEQEIEQYYNSNVQKNQLFQNDIRIAKRLQDEEEERMSQATLQLEEQDSEYARGIQEEIQRCAEETRRREEEDEEMAKRLQEEEIDSSHHGGTSDFPLVEGMAPRRDGACLELGELEQVLRDEELARMLQGEEVVEERRPLGKGPQKSNPRGDFRAAQVAQDEEIARFMQRQERKAQRRSCDLGQGSRQEHREPGDAHERRSTRERKVEVPQMPRERLDSEGLNSPGEDLSPDCQPPSPNCTISPPQAMRNIAEELDPTFQAKRRDSNPAGQTSGLSTSPSSHSGLHDHTQEPTFVPPTKRQSDKSGRPKAKEKKESCKQQ